MLAELFARAIGVWFAPAHEPQPSLDSVLLANGKFEKWCDHCDRGAVVTTKFNAEQPDRAPFAHCEECGIGASFCRVCKLKWSSHTNEDGVKLSCVAAICAPLFDIRLFAQRGRYMPNRVDKMCAVIARASTVLTFAPPSMMAEVKHTLEANKVCDTIANVQTDPEKKLRRLAVDMLLLHWPDVVARCSICEDPYYDAAPVPPTKAGRLRVDKAICKHAFCAPCLAAWVGASVEQQKHHIVCPETACTAQIYTDDIERIAPGVVFAQYLKLIRTDYRTRLLHVLREAVVGMAEDQNCRPCPSCRVVIYRFEGCSDFICACGHRFNFINATWPSIAMLEQEIVAIKEGSVVEAAEMAAAEHRTVPVHYRDQLERLADMGFVDFAVLVPLLDRHGGRLDRVVGALL
jgi:hypothetical protein